MRLAQIIPLVALLALLLLCWQAWRGQDTLDFSIPMELAQAQLEPLTQPTGERVRGMVVDDQGGPVRDAQIVLLAGEKLFWAESSVVGLFEFAGLPPGEHPVHVVAPEWVPFTGTLVVPNDEAVLTFREKQGAPPELKAMARSALWGQVSGLAPLEDEERPYHIACLPLPEAGDLFQAIPRWQALGPAGEFEIADLIHARYRLLLLPPYAGQGFWPDLLSSPTSPAVEIDFPLARAAEPLPLQSLASSIRGRVLEQADPTSPLPKSLPIAGALLRLFPIDSDQGPFTPPLAHSASDGSFTLSDLPAGRYRLELQVASSRREREFVLEPAAPLELEWELER